MDAQVDAMYERDYIDVVTDSDIGIGDQGAA